MESEKILVGMSEHEKVVQLDKWRDQFEKVYTMEIGDNTFVFRGISRAEYKRAVENYNDDLDRSEYVARLCVLSPTDIDYTEESHAGIPETLTEEILRISGFLNGQILFKELMLKYDNEMQSFDNQMSCIIATAFPQYRIEEIDSWNLEKSISYYAKAKWALATLRGITLEFEE